MTTGLLVIGVTVVAGSPSGATGGSKVSGVTVTQTSSATNAVVDYTVTFTTSSSGAMSGSAGNGVTVTFPAQLPTFSRRGGH